MNDVIGIDVVIEFSGGKTLRGHISPLGTHINRTQDEAERIRPLLEAMRESVHDDLKHYGEPT